MDIPTLQPEFHRCSHNPVLNLRQTIQLLGKYILTIPIQPTSSNVSKRCNIWVCIAGDNPIDNPNNHLFCDTGWESVFERPKWNYRQYVEYG